MLHRESPSSTSEQATLIALPPNDSPNLIILSMLLSVHLGTLGSLSLTHSLNVNS